MNKIVKITSLIACLSVVGVTAGYAQSASVGSGQSSGVISSVLNSLGLGATGKGGSGGGHGAPMPEIGASLLGLAIASGIAAYIHKRRRA
ncbi:MAG TPA: hypothetical protein VEK34_08920 [Methylocella sp.]|nr:hypothetical protein [Methylocella sp.]